MMDALETLKEKALNFRTKLDSIRREIVLPDNRKWYAYGILDNIWAVDQLLTGENRALFANLEGKVVADIGAADGDFAFLLESLGASVDIIDNGPTNMNGLFAARALKAALNSEVGIYDVDIDRKLWLPRKYDFALFLGILYHLKNPFGVLEQLAQSVSKVALSTRIANYTSAVQDVRRVPIGDVPVAYLLDRLEANNDPTNYWIFSESGLRRIVDRSGWELIDWKTFGGDMQSSDPATNVGDRRAFCLLKSRVYLKD